jgi:hypothetical protein
VLQRAFGEDAVLMDYKDNPADPCSRFSLDPEAVIGSVADLGGFEAVHGHFHLSKYDRLRDAFRVTFLRDPIENLFSIYFYWKGLERQGYCTHDYFLDQRLGILEMARMTVNRWLMTRTFFGGVDMDRFDYVGDHSTFTEDVGRLSNLIGRPLDASVRINLSDRRPYQAEYDQLRADPKIRSALQDIVADDLRFYERVRSRRA